MPPHSEIIFGAATTHTVNLLAANVTASVNASGQNFAPMDSMAVHCTPCLPQRYPEEPATGPVAPSLENAGRHALWHSQLYFTKLSSIHKTSLGEGPSFHTHTTSHQQHFHVKLECASGPSPTLTHEQHTALTAPLAQHLHAFLEAWHQREATWRSQRPQRCFAERGAEILSELLQVCLSVRPHRHPVKRTGFRNNPAFLEISNLISISFSGKSSLKINLKNALWGEIHQS